MEIDNFIKNLADEFDDLDSNELKANTKLRDIEGWSSLIALCVIGMCDDKYNVSISDEDISNSVSIDDLYKIVESKLK